MRKRTYRAVAVKQVERLVDGVSERLILGCDAAKELWYGAWMNEQGEVLQIIRWDLVEDTESVVALLQQLCQAVVGYRESEDDPGFDQPYRTGESHRADAASPIHTPDQRILEEAGEPQGDGGCVLCVVQLLPSSSDDPDDARDGSGLDGSYLDDERIA